MARHALSRPCICGQELSAAARLVRRLSFAWPSAAWPLAEKEAYQAWDTFTHYLHVKGMASLSSHTLRQRLRVVRVCNPPPPALNVDLDQLARQLLPRNSCATGRLPAMHAAYTRTCLPWCLPHTLNTLSHLQVPLRDRNPLGCCCNRVGSLGSRRWPTKHTTSTLQASSPACDVLCFVCTGLARAAVIWRASGSSWPGHATWGCANGAVNWLRLACTALSKQCAWQSMQPCSHAAMQPCIGLFSVAHGNRPGVHLCAALHHTAMSRASDTLSPTWRSLRSLGP